MNVLFCCIINKYCLKQEIGKQLSNPFDQKFDQFFGKTFGQMDLIKRYLVSLPNRQKFFGQIFDQK